MPEMLSFCIYTRKKKVVGISLLFTCKRIFMLKAHESKTSECDGIRLDVLLIAVYKAQG